MPFYSLNYCALCVFEAILTLWFLLLISIKFISLGKAVSNTIATNNIPIMIKNARLEWHWKSCDTLRETDKVN